MNLYMPGLARTFALSVALITSASAQEIKFIVDQDARGPGTSDQQAILVFLQSDKFDVLGITTVSDDQWIKEETQHVLRLLEISGRIDVPVYPGTEFPQLNSKEETERWEPLYGKFEYTRVLDGALRSQSLHGSCALSRPDHHRLHPKNQSYR